MCLNELDNFSIIVNGVPFQTRKKAFPIHKNSNENDETIIKENVQFIQNVSKVSESSENECINYVYQPNLRP